MLQAIGVDYIDESEVLTPADEAHHVDKWAFTVPFVCGATNLGEALRRIAEGAAMIRSKGEAGTGNVVEATRHMRQIAGDIRRLGVMREEELFAAAKELQAPYELVAEIAGAGKLPVVLFTAGGIATPADAALMMQLGAEGVFVGSGIFKSGDPARRAAAIVKATTFHDDPDVVAKVSREPRRGHGSHQHRHPRAGAALCGARLVKHGGSPLAVRPPGPPPSNLGVRRCSNGSPTRHAGSWSWPRRKPRCSAMVTSAPSTSCSACSPRAKGWRRGRWPPSGSAWTGPGADRGDHREGTGQPAGDIPFTPRTKKVLELSLREAQRLGDSYIGTEHILLGLAREGEGVGAQVLVRLGAGMDRVLAQVLMAKRAAPGGPRRVSVGRMLSRAHPPHQPP